MTSTANKRSNTDVAAPAAASAKRRRGKRNLFTVQEEQLLPDASSSTYSDICCQSCIRSSKSAKKTKYVSVCFYPARDYLPVVNSVSYGPVDKSPSFSLTSRSTRWRSVCLRLPMLCARRERMGHQSPSAKVVTFG